MKIVGYEKDARGNITLVRWDDGTHRHEYDERNNHVRWIWPNGDVWTYEWDDDKNLLRMITQPNGNEYVHEYDGNIRISCKVYYKRHL